MKRLRAWLKNPRVRVILVVLIVVITFGTFAYYLSHNPSMLSSVLSLDASTIALLSLAYVGTVIANAFVLWASLRLIEKPVGFSENIALTGYSSVVNFFGPLQSGPGFRAVYLKTKHAVSVKRFFSVTVLFYGFFAFINGAVILLAILAQIDPSLLAVTLAGLALITAVLILLARKSDRIHSLLSELRFTNPFFWFIGLGALALSVATAAAYFIELRHVDASITVAQTLIYTAAANLALFVSLTPGAIGFRESFLLLSQRLHDIPTDAVIAASVIDRAFYVVFLLVLFVVLLLIGARSRITASIKSSQ